MKVHKVKKVTEYQSVEFSQEEVGNFLLAIAQEGGLLKDATEETMQFDVELHPDSSRGYIFRVLHTLTTDESPK